MNVRLSVNLRELTEPIVNFYKLALEAGPDQPLVQPNLIVPTIHDIFRAITDDFDVLFNAEKLSYISTLLRSVIQETDIVDVNMANYIEDLFLKYSGDTTNFMMAVKIYHQLLNSLPSGFPPRQTYNDYILEVLTNHDCMSNDKLQPDLAICVLALIDKFNIKAPLESIWRSMSSSGLNKVLVNYIPQLTCRLHVYETVKFWASVEWELHSRERERLKSAIYVIRHVIVYLKNSPTFVHVKGYFSWSREGSEMYYTSWTSYLTIIENLEEKQSHLILPSLELMKNVSMDENTPWMRILFEKLFGHSNKLVLRWTVEYLIKHFDIVTKNNLLWFFLHATNNTWLHKDNEIGYYVMPPFEDDKDQRNFFDTFAKVDWKPLPIHVWLESMENLEPTAVDGGTLYSIAYKIHNLQNVYIRTDCVYKFVRLFSSCIYRIGFLDFTTLLDSLFTKSDVLPQGLLDHFKRILSQQRCPHLSYEICHMLTKSSVHDQSDLLDIFENIDKQNHKWFSVLATFRFVNSRHQLEFCKTHYGIDLSVKSLSYDAIYPMLNDNVAKLSWDSKSENEVCAETIDWSTRNFNVVNEDNYEELMSSGGPETLLNVATAFGRDFEMDDRFVTRMLRECSDLTKKSDSFSKSFLDVFVKSCAKYRPRSLHEVINRVLDMDVKNNAVAYQVFQLAENLCDFRQVESRELLMRGLLYGEPLMGEMRQEYEYLFRKVNFVDSGYKSTDQVRRLCLDALGRLDAPSRELLKEDLIAKSKEMAVKKPRYYENSKHHRVKLRIAQSLDALSRLEPTWNDYYLSALLDENNQTNVTYIYEYIAASTITEDNLMRQLRNLKNTSTSGQTSLFAVAYVYLEMHSENMQIVDDLITILLPFTMGSVFNTRLYAQITIYHVVKFSKCGQYEWLQNSIAEALKESSSAMEKLHTDLRYNSASYIKNLKTDPILYVTLVPEDEHLGLHLQYLDKIDEVRAAREVNLLKRQKQIDMLTNNMLEIESVQRKMDPEMNASRNNENKSEMIVVASLIDKLPNLGGLARTCEVLGIQNLVIGQISHTQCKEFKNLSMTAENFINITELFKTHLAPYLHLKKNEGYTIIGAEQTSTSVDFIGFEFPKKCVLVLGNEKEGISADLLTLLDYAVEIPQFGMVRSLNVHVTGALFMYEYCKQHLLSSTT